MLFIFILSCLVFQIVDELELQQRTLLMTNYTGIFSIPVLVIISEARLCYGKLKGNQTSNSNKTAPLRHYFPSYDRNFLMFDKGFCPTGI